MVLEPQQLAHLEFTIITQRTSKLHIVAISLRISDPTNDESIQDNVSTDESTGYRRRRRTGSLSKPSDDTTTQEKPKTPPTSRYTPPIEVFQSGGGEAEEREPVQHLQSRFQLEMNGVPATTETSSISLSFSLTNLKQNHSF